MKILLVNDGRTEAVNYYKYSGDIRRGVAVQEPKRSELRSKVNELVNLHRFLEKRHEVMLWDAYEDDLHTQITNWRTGLDRISGVIEEFKPDSILFDLHYFRQFDYGPKVLEELYKTPLLNDVHVVIGSHYFTGKHREASAYQISHGGQQWRFEKVKRALNPNTTNWEEIEAYLTPPSQGGKPPAAEGAIDIPEPTQQSALINEITDHLRGLSTEALSELLAWIKEAESAT